MMLEIHLAEDDCTTAAFLDPQHCSDEQHDTETVQQPRVDAVRDDATVVGVVLRALVNRDRYFEHALEQWLLLDMNDDHTEGAGRRGGGLDLGSRAGLRRRPCNGSGVSNSAIQPMDLIRVL